jgi:hypothetical protein
VSIYPLVPLVAVSVLYAVAQRPRRGRHWYVGWISPLAAAVLLLVILGPTVRVGPPDLFDDAVLLVDGGLLTYLVVTWQASRRRSRFDRRLHAALEDFNRAILEKKGHHEAAHAQWTARVDREGTRAMATIAALRPPDAAWSTVRDDYVRLTRAQLNAMRHGARPGEAEELALANARLRDRVLELRAKYRGDSTKAGASKPSTSDPPG